MAYKLSRKVNNQLTEQIELDNGEILDIKINIGRLSLHFNEAYNKILRLQGVKPNVTDVAQHFETLGNAAIDFIRLVLGKENTDTLLKHYEDDYISLLEEIVPFIEQNVKPAVIEYGKQKQKIASEKYKKNKRNNLIT